MKNLATALIQARREFSPVVKDGKNPHFKSTFPTLQSVHSSTDAALNNHGLAVVQFPTELQGFPALRTILLHESGETLEDTMLLNPVKNDPQGVGSALTYARRYALMAVLGIAAEDDDGNAASSSGPASSSSAPPPPAPKPPKPEPKSPFTPPAGATAQPEPATIVDAARTRPDTPVPTTKPGRYQVTTHITHVTLNDRGWYEINAIIDGQEQKLATKLKKLGEQASALVDTTVHLEFTEKQNGEYLNRYLESVEQTDAVQAIFEAAAAAGPVDPNADIPFAPVP